MNVRVLTADDNPAFRAALGEIVDAAPGFELVAETWSGEEAVRLVDRLRPDVALLDVRMSDIDGVETAARIAALDVGTVVVLLTAGEIEPLAPRAQAAGASAVLDKLRLRPGLLEEIWAEHGAPAA